MKRKNNSDETPCAKRQKLDYSDECLYVAEEPTRELTLDFVRDCSEEFGQDPLNVMARNAVVSVGAMNAALDAVEANKVSHVFLNSLKPETIRATNQNHSGRCWMYAGLNVYRYLVVKALNLENFEFSETYLFFYDKLERANYSIQYFIDNPGSDPSEDRLTNIMTAQFLDDGGYWNYFANLVEKYGLVPKEVMEETFNSGWSDEMNDILTERILACCFHIFELQRRRTTTYADLQEVKKHTMKQIYNTLVKFLGAPPKTFTWSFKDAEKNPSAITDLTPHKFKNMVLASINPKDFVVLCNIPGREFYKLYTVRNINNMIGGDSCIVLNLPINELKKYAAKSITSGISVWFAGDVSKGYCNYKSVLAEELFNMNLLFGETHKWNKGDKLKFGATEGNHAMVMTGVNFDEKMHPVQWQVENSWGYIDHEQLGLDGFLSMSNKWFEDNLIQIAVHKNFLSRNIQSMLNTEPEILEPWDYMAPALKVKTS